MTTAELAQLAELRSAVSDQTLDILERRRRSGVVRRRGWVVRRMLLAADLTGLCISFALTELLFIPITRHDPVNRTAEIILFCATLPLWAVVAKLYGLYDRDEEHADHSTVDELVGVFHLVTVGAWLLLAGAWITKIADPNMPKLAVFWASAISTVVLGRGCARALCRRRISYVQNTLVVGAGRVGQLVAQKLVQHREYGINLVGFVDSRPTESVAGLGQVQVVGEVAQLTELIRLFDIERVVIAFPPNSLEEITVVIDQLRKLDVQTDLVPRVFEEIGPRGGIHMVEGIPLIGIPPLRPTWSSLLIKRAVDVIVSSVMLVLLVPLALVIAIAIRFDSPGPILYRHGRVGLRGKRFRLLKFRTMKLEFCRGSEYGGETADAAFSKLMNDPERRAEFEATQKLETDPRVTRLGHVLRRFSVDELPQLVNVLRGDISLVGPRPITAEELNRYGDKVEQLLGLRPGLTGYWQINGRSRLSYEDRVRLDISYCNNWSLGLDLTILAKTARVLATRGEAF
jgi:exopolysaccharide biosynthesis polyprenyl glycosylphosphotransferase